MTPPLLIHLHIPKNAGTTLSRMLKLGILLRPPTRMLDGVHTLGYYPLVPWEKRIARINELPESRRRSIRFFEAHCGFGVGELLPTPNQTITMLREPVDRTLSVFSFLRQNGNIPRDMPLDRFLDQPPTDRVWWVDNAQVRYLAGEKGQIDQRPIGACTEGMLRAALRRLNEGIALAGLVERYEESAVLIRRILGWGPGASIRSNTTRERASLDAVSNEQLGRVRSLNALDSELYREGKELFARKVAEAGQTFSGAVGRSGRASRTWSRILGPALERRTVARRQRRRSEPGG